MVDKLHRLFDIADGIHPSASHEVVNESDLNSIVDPAISDIAYVTGGYEDPAYHSFWIYCGSVDGADTWRRIDSGGGPTLSDGLPEDARAYSETVTEGGTVVLGAEPGVSAEAARADHIHIVATAAPLGIGFANAEGVSGALARADHVHDSTDVLASIGAAWTVEVDSNLSTEANFSFANGTQSWLGKTWTGLNIAGNVDSFGVVNGTGVVLDHSGANTDWYMPVNTAPRLYLPFSQLPSFRFGQSIVRLWMDMRATGLDANFETAKFGIETIPYSSNARRFWAVHLDQSGLLSSQMLDNTAAVAGLNATNAATARVGMVELDTSTLLARWFSKVPTAAIGAANSTEFTFSSMRLITAWRPAAGMVTALDASRSMTAATADNLCAVFGLQTVNSTNTALATWRRIRIEVMNPI